MTVDDPVAAEVALRRIGYYRLSGYWHPHRERGVDANGDRVVQSTFRTGTTFRQVLDIYDFDRAIRAALLDALEKTEVAIRFQVGHALGRRDAFAHRNPACLDPAFARPAVTTSGAEHGHPADDASLDDDNGETKKTRHDEWLERFDEQEVRSQEPFAVHFREKYGPHLPVWVATEVMSFGTLVQLYNGSAQDDRDRIAASFDLITKDGKGDATLLASWLNHIRHIRNLCAHHSRVWNRNFNVELAVATQIPDLGHLTAKSNRRLYGTISVLTFLLARIELDSSWSRQIRSLIESQAKHLDLDLDALGFPDGWKEADIWGQPYVRDPFVARRVALLSTTDAVASAGARELLHCREQKERRSWLNYLRQKHALMWFSPGEVKYHPTFQFDEERGDIHPIVGDINEELYECRVDAGWSDEEARLQILEWWTSFKLAATDRTPQDLLQTGELTLDIARPSVTTSQPPASQ